MIKAMAHPLHTLFAPHPHNNHKARILARESILILLGLLIIGRSFVDILTSYKPGILGFASQISPEKVIEYTNIERQSDNLPPLVYNSELSEAAQAKAIDMFEHNYWAQCRLKGQSLGPLSPMSDTTTNTPEKISPATSVTPRTLW